MVITTNHIKKNICCAIVYKICIINNAQIYCLFDGV